MSKEKTIKTGLDIERAKRTIEFCKLSGKPFEVFMTNYTITVKGIVNIAFIKEEKSFSFFNNFRLLKKEVETFLKDNEIEPVEDKKYFDIVAHKNFIADEVFNVDLSSAYLHVLKNCSIISVSLFNILNKLPKMDRLAVVGMLASSKSRYQFNERGEITDIEQIENRENRNVFFYCVQQTALLMQTLKEKLGEAYIFSWVDGVYFKGAHNVKIVTDYLDSVKYPCTVDVLNNFEYYRNGKTIEIDFNRQKDGAPKCFSIPLESTNFAENVYRFLQNNKNKNNKK